MTFAAAKNALFHPYRSAEAVAPQGHQKRLRAMMVELGMTSDSDLALGDLMFVYRSTRREINLTVAEARIVAKVVANMFVVSPRTATILPYEVKAYLERRERLPNTVEWTTEEIHASSKLSAPSKGLVTYLLSLSPVQQLITVRLAQSALALHAQNGVSLSKAVRMVGLTQG
ncbi:hypothetical protein [Gemmatimonas sp.]|uniref:hypothetical protein n=1 Tax=Gemmatimonas sp. TaxID=1962908 RepID=UPI003DA56190